jgi:hypothetical protein
MWRKERRHIEGNERRTKRWRRVYVKVLPVTNGNIWFQMKENKNRWFQQEFGLFIYVTTDMYFVLDVKQRERVCVCVRQLKWLYKREKKSVYLIRFTTLIFYFIYLCFRSLNQSIINNWKQLFNHLLKTN